MKYITLFLFESELEAGYLSVSSDTNKCSLAVDKGVTACLLKLPETFMINSRILILEDRYHVRDKISY